MMKPELKARFFSRTRSSGFCPRCENAVELFRSDEAAAFYKTTIGEIAALSEAGDLHRIYSCFGEILICSDSLVRELSSRETHKRDAELLPRLI